MRLLSRIALVFAGLTLSSAVVGAELTPHRAEYKVRISGLSGQLNTELRQTEDGYIATHVIKPTGVLRVVKRGKMQVSSEFETASYGVRPVTYHAIDNIGNDPEAHISFDWSTNVASGTVGGEPFSAQLDGLSHDSVSIQYELMLDLINENPDARYTLFDVDKMRIANVEDAGEKTLETKAGRYAVLGIRHQKEGSSRVTTLWCAPELDYLPVVIEQHRKGKLNFRATLVTYQPT